MEMPDPPRTMPPQPSAPGVGVVGCGPWGQHLMRNFMALGALRAICDTDPARLRQVGERYPDLRLTGTLADLLGDATLAALIIATPSPTHYALAREALLAGKDVLVEKPLALRLADGRDLVEIAGRAGRILMVGHLLRYHPAVRALKQVIDHGTLGKIHYLYSNRLNLGRVRTEENILWSFAPHDVSVILHLLGEQPVAVSAHGGSYLSTGVPDVTVTTMEFRTGVRGHIFVSWLHPFKEQKLIVVGDRGMAVFDDVEPERKLLVLDHAVEWVGRQPVARRREAESVPFARDEPLRLECQHFLDCIRDRRRPETDGEEGLRVLAVLEACQESLNREGAAVAVSGAPVRPYRVHPTAVVDEPVEIGAGTQVWHYTHIMTGARVGAGCTIGQNVFIGRDVVIGDNVKIQNNVSVYTGVILEDDVFCGPSMVFTNVINPRSAIPRKDEFRPTLVRRGATLGANCTVICGHTIGRYALVGAGAVVTRDVPDHALVVGIPGRIAGWVCECGATLAFEEPDAHGRARAGCAACGRHYLREGESVSLDAAPGRSRG